MSGRVFRYQILVDPFDLEEEEEEEEDLWKNFFLFSDDALLANYTLPHYLPIFIKKHL